MIIFSLWMAIQFVVGFFLVNPFLLLILNCFAVRKPLMPRSKSEKDYAIIVTAYEQTDLIPAVVKSILRLNYTNFMVYIVADKCDISNLHFTDARVVLLRPETVLGSNTMSHLYAIENFKRAHDFLTIIDSDNLVDPDYIKELNVYFDNGFLSVQGVRKAKNLDTKYACLDEAGDMFYRMIDRKLLFDLGSSASLAGSGMAFSSAFYKACIMSLNIEGAGFDKALQMEILHRGEQIAFAEKAIVYDEKTSNPKQLVNQRARWINAWFKYAKKGISLAGTGIVKLSWNQFASGVVFTKPPIFILVALTGVIMLVNLFIMPSMLIVWGGAILSFVVVFLYALFYFKAPKVVYLSLASIPLFIFYQVQGLFKAKNANQISTATKHAYISEIDDL
jgi:cellulose synthase/poly-beta-1,6-N-acetylglucosamine synthase-like glycosyltransferase